MSNIKLINIGFGSVVLSNRIICVVSPESAPIKRMIQDAKKNKKLIDATYGRKTRSVIVVDTEHIILSSIQTETIANRIFSKERNADTKIDEQE